MSDDDDNWYIKLFRQHMQRRQEEQVQLLAQMQQSAQQNLLCYTSGGVLNVQDWQTTSAALNSPLNQSNFGALGQQALTPTQLANQQALDAYAAQQSAYTQLANPFFEPESIEDAGISAGEIIAHRAWRIKWPDALLTSMAVSTVWAPNEAMTGESHRQNRGVHAFKSASLALTEYGCEGPVAIGTVLLWGEVIEHEFGYRAEYGKINSIDLLTNITIREIPRRRTKWWRLETDEEREQYMLWRLRVRYGV